MGSIYRPKYKDKNTGQYKESGVYWIKYYRAGKPYRENTHTTKESEAKRKLQAREGQIAENRFFGLKVEKVRFDELAEDFINDYKINGKKSIGRAERSVRNLKSFFEGVRAIDVTTDRIRAYILQRQEERAENATINRELAALKRMFNLARQMTPPKVTNVPYIPHLQENNVRTGFFEYPDYIALRNALPSYLKPVVTMAYYTGMRKEEILNLQWPQVDLLEGRIALRPQDTKNSEIKTIYMEGELLEAIRFQKVMRDSHYPTCPWVFFGETGERIKDFRGSWDKALQQCGYLPAFKCKDCRTVNEYEPPEKSLKKWRANLTCKACGSSELRRHGKITHDFRRSGVRNMVRAGVPERVAMMVSGHKTRSVFERYNIVNEDDLKRASRKVTEYHKTKANPMDGQSLGKVNTVEHNLTFEDRPVIH